eukprot:420083_1
MAFVFNDYVTNRLISLLSKVGELNRPTLYSQVDYQSVERLILTSSSLLPIVCHPLFKQSTNESYHRAIYASIISYTDIYEKELYAIITELDANENFLISISNVISQVILWKKRLKQLRKEKTQKPQAKVKQKHMKINGIYVRQHRRHFYFDQHDGGTAVMTFSQDYSSVIKTDTAPHHSAVNAAEQMCGRL